MAPSPVERHQEQQSARLTRPPRITNVNPLIAELNQPRAHFDNVLEALRPATITTNKTTRDDNHNDPCNPAPPTKKANQVTPLASPMGVDMQPSNESTPTTNTNKNTITTIISNEKSPHARVRISKARETANVNLSPAAPNPTSRRSILQPTTKGTSHSLNSFISDDNDSQNKTHIKEVHDCSNMLFKEYSNDDVKETGYHVTDFTGLYPVWPIIESLMAPTGETKDDCMTSFTKCVVALLGEILYVDDTAKIATISIMEDESCYIGSKADVPAISQSLGNIL
jgi:hypothetical protein